eukprot:scaffold186901_cov28-Tisochrysis_lutea.AAC.3
MQTQTPTQVRSHAAAYRALRSSDEPKRTPARITPAGGVSSGAGVPRVASSASSSRRRSSCCHSVPFSMSSFLIASASLSALCPGSSSTMLPGGLRCDRSGLTHSSAKLASEEGWYRLEEGESTGADTARDIFLLPQRSPEARAQAASVADASVEGGREAQADRERRGADGSSVGGRVSRGS